MNLLRGLYFPGTGPDRQFCPSLGGLFERIDLYLVDEEDRAGGEGEGGGDVCRPRAVLPLGEDRGRFLAMIGDIRAHADEYYEGFLASLSAPGTGERDESSVWNLVASLHEGGREGGRARALVQKQWQARLVLKLAEIVAAERAEIESGLAALERREQELLGALRGEIEELTGAGQPAGEPLPEGGGGTSGARNRLAAWGVLYSADTTDHDLLLTDDEESCALLFDAYEELASGPPEPVAELMVGEDGGEELARAAGALRELASGEGATSLETLKEITAGRRSGPGTVLSVHLLAGEPWARLWERLSGVTAAAAADDRILVGVLRRP